MDEKRKETLKEVLKKLHEAGPDKLKQVKKEAAGYFKQVAAEELAMAEQELIGEGLNRKDMKRLCDVHLEVMKEQLARGAKPVRLPAWHPIRISMDEHEVIKKNLKRLKSTLGKLKSLGSFDKAKRQLDAIRELAHFFLETDKHHKREEEALFPRLEVHGITEPPLIFKEEHVEFMAKKRELYQLLTQGGRDYKELVRALEPIVDFLTENLESHIYKEDNILYPMALNVLTEEEWEEVRRKFDQIGY